jgi:serine phosphatase RsbU (regulator of sigma subunit)
LDTIGRQLPLPLPVPDWSKPIIAVLLLVAAILAVRLRRAAMHARRLEREDEVLLEDVEAMQMALVPEVPGGLEGLTVSAAFHPAEGPAAGGDFYDVFAPSAGKAAIMLGDSCGHGREALAHAALTRYTLRAYLQAGLRPRAALQLAGKVLADPERDRYATAVVALYESQSGTLTYATAGHPAPIICGPGVPRVPRTMASPPIGWDTLTGRAQTRLSLSAGTVACFFSDGLTDARRDGELLGHDRLVNTLRSLGPRPVAAQLLDRLRAQADGTPDDMAACIIVPEVTVDAVFTHIQELELDARGAEDVAVLSFLEECSLAAVEITKALERAREIASRCGTALLTVHWTGAGATVIVTPPEAQTHEVTLLEPEPRSPYPTRLGGRRLGSSTAI